MVKSRKHVIKQVAGFFTIRWKCANCGNVNTWPTPAVSGIKTIYCLDCFSLLRVELTVKQFAYHYRRVI